MHRHLRRFLLWEIHLLLLKIVGRIVTGKTELRSEETGLSCGPKSQAIRTLGLATADKEESAELHSGVILPPSPRSANTGSERTDKELAGER
jgi:hypothetical protein